MINIPALMKADPISTRMEGDAIRGMPLAVWIWGTGRVPDVKIG